MRLGEPVDSQVSGIDLHAQSHIELHKWPPLVDELTAVMEYERDWAHTTREELRRRINRNWWFTMGLVVVFIIEHI